VSGTGQRSRCLTANIASRSSVVYHEGHGSPNGIGTKPEPSLLGEDWIKHA
jgi:hypothetical protein